MKLRSTLFLVILCISVPLQAQQIYKATLVEGALSITIDGDLSDWEKLPAKSEPLKNIVITKSIPHKPTDQFDLSANFRCIANRDNIYVTVAVFDDKIIFGEEKFGLAHNDDAVEVYFDGDLASVSKYEYDANDAEIRFSKDKEGKIVLEGMGLFGGKLIMLPGLWESLGIVAAIQENPQGYTAELKVPKGVFISTPLRVGSKFGFNVMVNDDDDGGGRDSKISWTADLKDESWMTTKYFGKVLIERVSSP